MNFKNLILKHSLIIFISSFIIIVLVIKYLNVFFIDPLSNDEIVGVAFTKRFLLGDKPFIDEINLVQTPQVLTLPLFKFYHKLVKNYDGLVLFSRHLFLIMNLIVALMAILTLQKRLEAIFASLIFLVFIPASIPNLSYYSFGIYFFIISRFLSMKKTTTNIFFCGISDTVSIISFFPFGIISIITTSFTFFRKPQIKFFIFYVLGIICILLPFFYYIGFTPIELLKKLITLLNTTRFPHKNLIHLERFYVIFKKLLPYIFKPIYLLMIFTLIFSTNEKVRFILYCIFPIVLWWINRASKGGLGEVSFIIQLMFMAPIILGNEIKDIFTKFWFPSVLCGFFGAFFSVPALSTLSIGCILGVFTILYGISLKGVKYFISSGLLIIALMQFEFKIWFLKDYSNFNKGPFKSMYMSKERALEVENLSKIVERIPYSENMRLLTIPTEKMTHLLSNLKPLSQSLWGFCLHMASKRKCMETFLAKFNEIRGVIIFKTKINPNNMKLLYKKIVNECTLDFLTNELELYICNYNLKKISNKTVN